MMHVLTPDNVSVQISEWLLSALFDKSPLTDRYCKKQCVREASKILTLYQIFVKLLQIFLEEDWRNAEKKLPHKSLLIL